MEAAAVETASAPDVTPEAPAPEQTTEATTPTPVREFTSAPDMLAAVSERSRGIRPVEAAVPEESTTVSEPVVDAQGRVHDPVTGKYLPEGEAQPDAEAATPAAEATEEPGATSVPPGFVKLPLPEGHPLRDRGREFLIAPEGQEAEYRSLINQPARKEHLTRAVSERDEARREVARVKAEAEFWETHGGEVFGPDFQQRYKDILETYGQEEAEAYKAGKLQEVQGRLQEAQQEADRAFNEQEAVTEAGRFRNAVLYDALGDGQNAGKFPHWTEHEVRSAIQSFGAYINQRVQVGEVVELNAQNWYRFAAPLYAAKPEVQAELRARGEAESAKRIEEEAQRREKERLEAAAQTRATNPMGTMPAVQTDRAGPPTDRKETAPEMMARIARQAKGIK